MKTVLALALLSCLVTSSSFAQEPPSLFESMRMCTYYSVKATEYTVIAQAVKKDDADTYKAIILPEINAIDSQRGKEILAFLAGVAWKNRAESSADVGMAVYEDCLKHTGTST